MTLAKTCIKFETRAKLQIAAFIACVPLFIVGLLRHTNKGLSGVLDRSGSKSHSQNIYQMEFCRVSNNIYLYNLKQFSFILLHLTLLLAIHKVQMHSGAISKLVCGFACVRAIIHLPKLVDNPAVWTHKLYNNI